MRLPNARAAVVERGKITEYLLNGAHPDNGGKAAFFRRLGFRGQEWRALAAAFRELAQTTAVSERLESRHGMKYVFGRYDSGAERKERNGAGDLDR